MSATPLASRLVSGPPAVLIVLWLCWFGTSPGLQGREPSPLRSQTSGHVGGVVVVAGASGLEPVPGATVHVEQVDSRGVWEVVSDDEGRFEVVGLPFGLFTVSGRKAPHLTSPLGGTRYGEPGVPLVVSESQPVTSVVLRLFRGAVIAGRVSEMTGEAAVGVTMSLSPDVAHDPVVTDDRGYYRFFGLPPDNYLVVATPQRGRPLRGTEVLPEGAIDSAFASFARGQSPTQLPGAVSASYAPVYHPATVSRDQAAEVQVGEGEQHLGVDVLLVLASTLRVQGSLLVRDPDYELGQATVFLFSAGQRSRHLPIRAMVTSAGTFSLANVPPGHYRLAALSRARLRTTSDARSADTVPLWGEVELHITGGDVADVTVELGRGVTVTGRAATHSADARTRAVGSRLVLRRLDLQSAVNPLEQNVSVISADGSFRFDDVPPGHYEVQSEAPGVWLVQAVLNGEDIRDTGFRVDGDVRLVDGMSLVLAEEQTNLHGQLVVPPESSPTTYQVILFPASRSLWELAARLLATRPATDGSYLFRNVPAGAYHLAVLSDLNLDWRDPSFLNSIVRQSVAVSVPNAGPTQINLDAR